MADQKKLPAPIPVVTPAGKTGYLPPEFAQDAGEAGSRRASDAELRTEQGHVNEEATADALRRKFEGDTLGGAIEGKFAPQAAGMLRGLSLGTSDEAILRAAEILGGPEGRESVRRRLNDYKEYAPVRSTAGELGGVVVGTLAGDELAMGAAPGLVGRAGVAAERAVAGLGGGAVARGAGVLARGAVEGGAFGAGDAISEASLQNHDLTAEALIGGAAHGAMGGVLAAGLFGAAGKVVSGLRAPKATAAAFDGLASRTYGEAAPGVGRAIADEAAAGSEVGATYVDGEGVRRYVASDGVVLEPSPPAQNAYRTPGARAADVGPGDPFAAKYIENLPGSTAEKQAQHGEAWANRSRVFDKNAETVENHSRTFATDLNEALSAGRQADMASFGEAKVNQMSLLVDQSKFGEQAAAAVEWATDAHKIVQKLSGDAASGMGPTQLRQWDAYMQRIASAIESGEGVKLHTALDETKRFAGRQSAYGKGPFGLTVAQREFDEMYQGERGLKQLLESDVWGEKAAAAQKRVNSATFQMLSEGKLFTRKFTTEFGSEAGRPLYAADTAAISGFMNRLTSSANDLDARGVTSWIDARRGFLGAIEQSYTFDAQAAKAITKEKAALDRLEATYKTATKDVTLANQVRAALSEERERGMGGAIGAVMDIANKPYTTLQRLAQIESHTKSVLDKLSGDTRKLVGAGPAANDGAAAVVSMKPPKASGQGFFSALLDKAGKSAPGVGGLTSRDLYHRRVDEIGRMQGNPSVVASRIGASLEPLGEAAPKVSAAATAIALRGIDYLAGKLPPSRLDPYSLQPQLQPRNRASDAEISQFMRSVQAVDDPLIVLREAHDGTLTRDHVEAVKAIYPALYDKMREQVMRMLVDSKNELPYAKRIQLGILLDIPTDKTLSPEFLRAIQATYSGADQAGAESPPPTITPPNIAGSAQTASQQAVERAA